MAERGKEKVGVNYTGADPGLATEYIWQGRGDKAMTEGLWKHRTEAGKRSSGRGRELEEFGPSHAELMKAA